jgi:5-methyltetrahydropteroyltriglutamate--homocysteine methyltransferase
VALRSLEDRLIADAVAMQAEVGLPLATDGEFRRSFWHYDFLDLLDGVSVEYRPSRDGLPFAGTTLRPFYPAITGPIDFPTDHPMLEHFRALAAVCSTTPKISIPGPSTVHFRTAASAIAPHQYRDLDVLLGDIATAYAKAIAAFYEAGCRYLQIDDIFFAYLCDPDQRAAKQAEGFDPDDLITRYAAMVDTAIAGRPDDLTIAMHLCRGNFRSTHAATGGYDPAVDAIFNATSVDVYYLEYDTERAGSLEPLQLLPAGDKRIMLGLITTKTADLESLDDLMRRVEEANRYVDLDQLGIAPQCGFASTEEGNLLTEAEQRAKLELVVHAANAIWG